MSSFKIDYLDDISKYSGIFDYGSFNKCFNMSFYVSFKVSSSRYFVCDFIDKQPDGKLVFRTLDHIYHKIKFDKIMYGAFVDPITNKRIDIEKFYKIICLVKKNNFFDRISYWDDSRMGYIEASFCLESDNPESDEFCGPLWRNSFSNVNKVPFSFYIDSLMTAYDQYLKK